MNIFFAVIVFFCFCQLVYPQQCRQQVTTVCDEQAATPFKGEKGDVGLPGKAGIAGIKGAKGEKGHTMAIDAFEEEIRQELKDLAQCSGGVVVGRICYMLPFRVGSRFDFAQAGALCSFQGGLLAEIPTRKVYDAVFNYVKTTWSLEFEAPTALHIGIWLGMRYQGGRAILRNGSTAFTSWHPSYPLSESRFTKMGIQVPIRPNFPTKGMWNSGSAATAIPLCEFELA